ncbi:MAG: hypothetical protein LBR61_04140, partial [Synergistaceae bacterium]|nr:hypothetical protein [Synergistaceae bacterium]
NSLQNDTSKNYEKISEKLGVNLLCNFTVTRRFYQFYIFIFSPERVMITKGKEGKGRLFHSKRLPKEGFL